MLFRSMDQILDEHLEDDDGSCDSEGNGDKEGKGKGRPKISAEERQKIKDEMKAAVLQAAQAVGAGNLPAGVKRLIDQLTNPKMNWRELIRQQIQATLKSDFTFARPSRRGWHMEAILPGMKPGEQIDICVAIDMSGSISNEQAVDFLTEIKGITDQFEEFKLHVWCFDTEVYNPQVFTSDGEIGRAHV